MNIGQRRLYIFKIISNQFISRKIVNVEHKLYTK